MKCSNSVDEPSLMNRCNGSGFDVAQQLCVETTRLMKGILLYGKMRRYIRICGDSAWWGRDILLMWYPSLLFHSVNLDISRLTRSFKSNSWRQRQFNMMLTVVRTHELWGTSRLMRFSFGWSYLPYVCLDPMIFGSNPSYLGDDFWKSLPNW